MFTLLMLITVLGGLTLTGIVFVLYYKLLKKNPPPPETTQTQTTPEAPPPPEEEELTEEDVEEIEYFKDKLYTALYTLVSGARTPQLKWWEVIIIVIVCVLAGFGFGAIAYAFLPKQPKILLIPINETHIIRVVR